MLNDLRLLGSLAAGSILLAAIYGVVVNDQKTSWSYETDGDRTTHSVSGDNAEFVSRNDVRTLRAKWRGNLELTSDALGISALERRLEIVIENGSNTQTVVLSNRDDEIERTLEINGEKQSPGPEIEAEIDRIVTEFLTVSGVNAEERVAALLKNGDADAVITSIDSLEKDDLIRRYVAELVASDKLSAAQIGSLADIIDDMDNAESRRRTIAEITKRQNLAGGAAKALLAAVDGIDNDHDRRRALEAFAQSALDDAEIEEVISLLSDIDNDHDRRKTITAFFEGGETTPEQNAALLAEGARILESDHDIRRLLEDALNLEARGEIFQAAWLSGFDLLSDDYDRRKSLSSAASAENMSQQFLVALIGRTASIRADDDKRLALENFAELSKLDPALREAYEAAARSIDGDTERRIALDAIKN